MKHDEDVRPADDVADDFSEPTDPGESHDDDENEHVEIVHSSGWRSARATLARYVLWTLLAVTLAVDQRDHLSSRIPGDIGDSYLVLSLLQWGGDRALHAYSGFWSGPIFAGSDAMAYSDPFLPLTIPFKLIEAISGSGTIAFNVLYLGAWILCAEATFALARRQIGATAPAIVSAVAFTYSIIRVGQSNHFQLAWSGLIPLCFLLLFRLSDRPGPRRGLLLAASVLCLVLVSAYHGVIVLIVCGVAATVAIIRSIGHERARATIIGYGSFLVAVAIPMLFVRAEYESAADGVIQRDAYPAPFALRPGDLLSPPPNATVLRPLGFLDSSNATRSPENHAYVGVLVLLAVPFLVYLAARHRSDLRRLMAHRSEMVTMALAALLACSIAIGRWPVLGVEMPFYDIAASTIPGIDQMVALVRLVVFAQLLLAVLVGVVTAWLLQHLRSTPMRSLVVAVLVLVVVAEAAMDHPMVEVVSPRPGSVNEYLEDQDEGVVLLLPMAPLDAGILHPFIEAPRMVLGANDSLTSVNGYSGYAPKGYNELALAMNEFPMGTSLDEITSRGIRYVVIYTAPPDVGDPGLNAALAGSAYAFWPTEEAQRRIAAIPSSIPISRHDATDGIVLEFLRP